MKFPLFAARPQSNHGVLPVLRFHWFLSHAVADAEGTGRSVKPGGRLRRSVPLKLVAALFLMVSIALVVVAESLCGSS